jgi:hypothetical protein
LIDALDSSLTSPAAKTHQNNAIPRKTNRKKKRETSTEKSSFHLTFCSHLLCLLTTALLSTTSIYQRGETFSKTKNKKQQPTNITIFKIVRPRICSLLTRLGLLNLCHKRK